MKRAAALLVLAACVAGCRRESALPMEQSQFVDVMVALRRASVQLADTGDFESRKRSILRRAGVTEDQLRAYARLGTRDPRALSEAYDSIAARVQRFSEPE